MLDLFKISYKGALILSASLFLLAFLNPHAAIDIQQYDVYFVFTIATLYNGLGSLLLLKTVLVFWLKRKTDSNRLLSWNLVVDLGIVVLLVGLIFYYRPHLGGVPRRYYRVDGFQSFSEFSPQFLAPILVSIGILYLLNQLFFMVIMFIRRA